MERLEEAGLILNLKPEFKPISMPNIGEACPRPYQLNEMIQRNADYGRIVCHCEQVTRREILDATQAVIPAHDFDSLRRRTRAQMGRCQGFFCSAEVTALLVEATGQPVTNLLRME
jgi:glycerol-3-phosphate dehydrogenase